jgi:ParB family chromosome partitioning protein
MTHEEVAHAVGRSRTAVTNLLRLLALADEVKDLLAAGKLEMGHARALLPLTFPNQIAAALKIAEKGLSVREAEDLARGLQLSRQNTTEDPVEIDPLLLNTQQVLTHLLNTRVIISQNAKGRGKIVIKYRNGRELERIMQLLNRCQLKI